MLMLMCTRVSTKPKAHSRARKGRRGGGTEGRGRPTPVFFLSFAPHPHPSPSSSSSSSSLFFFVDLLRCSSSRPGSSAYPQAAARLTFSPLVPRLFARLAVDANRRIHNAKATGGAAILKQPTSSDGDDNIGRFRVLERTEWKRNICAGEAFALERERETQGNKHAERRQDGARIHGER